MVAPATIFFVIDYLESSSILTIGRLASSISDSSSSTVGHSYLRVLYSFSNVFKRI